MANFSTQLWKRTERNYDHPSLCIPHTQVVTPVVPTADRPGGATTTTSIVPRISVEAVLPVLPPLFSALLGRMTQPNYPENDYLMKTLMRLVAIAKEKVAPMASQVRAV